MKMKHKTIKSRYRDPKSGTWMEYNIETPELIPDYSGFWKITKTAKTISIFGIAFVLICRVMGVI